ncbi:DUF4386 family protein [Nocardioides marmorisolisilvae]|uniref:DUF4386 family protein n=1 Tax=Nocardioides marmorisolisilvae TaxID=1542737 RepID=A0A3N0DTC1_9ACTN|nr:DUF4386 family protein [Nocardioides marmorisolisilvae]RNL78761.1 DUF4386 family protein [Nocardioides marmorisolisilvae]
MTTQTLTRPTRTDASANLTMSALGLVGFPLLILTYFALYPAYGETKAAAVFSSISADTGRTQLADVFGLLGCVLAVPAALAFLRVLRPGSPRVAAAAACCTIVGWIAVATSMMTDPVAVELGDEKAFHAVYTNPVVLAVNVTASLHLIGAVLIGVALIRTRTIHRGLAIAMTAAPVVHLTSNLARQFWLDALTWMVTAAAGVAVLRVLSRASGGGA